MEVDLLLEEFSNTSIIQVACCCIQHNTTVCSKYSGMLCIITMDSVQHVIKYSVEMRITIICTYTHGYVHVDPRVTSVYDCNYNVPGEVMNSLHSVRDSICVFNVYHHLPLLLPPRQQLVLPPLVPSPREHAPHGVVRILHVELRQTMWLWRGSSWRRWWRWWQLRLQQPVNEESIIIRTWIAANMVTSILYIK